MLGEQEKLLLERLRPKFYSSIITFPEFNFHDFLLASDQNIYISAKLFRKKSTALKGSSF
jgi:hypothetical protein